MKKIFLIILTLLVIAPPAFTFAQEYTLLEPLPCIEGVGKCEPGTITNKLSINDYVLYVYKFAIGISVFLAIIVIIWGGFEYVISQTPFGKSDGKSKIVNAVTGLGFVLASYLILLTIDPRLVNIDTNIPPIKLSQEDINAVEKFYEDSSKDISTDLVAADDAKNELAKTELDNKLAELRQQKLAAEAKSRFGDAAEVAEGGKEMIKIQTEINKIEVEKMILDGQTYGANTLVNITKLLNDPKSDQKEIKSYIDVPVKNTSAGLNYPTNTPNVIQGEYNKKMNEILATNQNLDKALVLASQRDFYIAQAKEVYDLNKKLQTYLDVKITRPVYAEDRIRQYTGEIKNATVNSKNTGLTPEQYTTAVQIKIDFIKQKLNPPKP